MGENKVFSKVFLWLFVGLLVSGVTAFYVSNQPNMMYNIYEENWYFWLVIAELAVVIFLSARIHKMSHMTAIISYLLYSILTGTTLSVIFAAFTTGSIAIVFGITALIFAIFAMIGYTTKADLSKWTNILLIGLLAVIIVGIINIFIGSDMIALITSIITVVLFVGFIAYDIQKIKYLTTVMDDENKIAIIGALELYLDFINIFIHLLSIFGRRD